MEVRQGSVLQQSSGGQVGSVEVTGPILPHNMVGLARLFSHVSRGNFTATVGGVHDASLSFNSLPQDDVDQPSQSVNREHLLPQDVCHAEATLGHRAVRELSCINGLYTWTC